MRALPLISLFAMTLPAFSATVITDNFESGSVSSGWDLAAGTSVSAGGPAGSSNYLGLAASTGRLGEKLNGATDFVIDYYFRIRDTGDRKFNLMVSTFTGNIGTGNATINLRYQGGSWGLYSGSSSVFVAVPGLSNSVVAGEWYRMQVEGTGWGTAGASYTLRLSDAGGATFTSSSTVTTVHNGSIVNPGSTSGGNTYTGKGEFFIFNTEFGTSPGYDLDNIFVTAVPEASSIALLGAAVPFLVRRRRTHSNP